MEVKEYTYEEFPAFNEQIEGIHYLETTGNELGVNYRKDVVYEVKDGIERHLQILEPTTRNEPNKKYPVFIYVQGSAWKKQDVYKGIPMLGRIASKGYCVAIVEYRESSIATFPSQAMDARNAIRYMSLHASEYNGDSTKMFVGGNSSGGHTALLALLLNDVEEVPNELKEGKVDIKGVIDLYGAVDMTMQDSFPNTLEHHTLLSPEGMEMGCDMLEHPEVAIKGSVKTYIHDDTQLPPVLIFHGAKDRSVNATQSAELYKTLKKYHKDVELYILKDTDHGAVEFFDEKYINIMDEFMKNKI